MSDTGRTFGDAGGARRLLSLGGVGAVAFLLALVLDAEGALHAYLIAYAFGLSLALGALCLLMIMHVTGAGWFVAVRRIAEAVVATLPLFALLFVPILLGLDVLYPWAGPLESLSDETREAVAAKGAYLDPRFFTARAAVYLAVWVGLGGLLLRWSVREDREKEPVGRPVVLSAVGLPLFAFTVTFAAFDWIMSLDPAWYSTMLGIYYFAGSFVGSLALMVLLVRLARREGLLPAEVAVGHHHALGRLLLTFVAFWAYIAFSQAFIVWIADIPSEVEWYLARWREGWGVVLLLLGIGHFVVPFFLLLSRKVTRRPSRLAFVAGWILVLHWLDVYWLVMPTLAGRGPWPGWEQLTALAGVLGLVGAFGFWRVSSHAPVPAGDPRLIESLGYESS